MQFQRAKPQFVCFAPIDLKNAVVRLRDGWGVQTVLLSVTNAAEEPLAETIIALTNCGAQIPVGCTVHFGNDSTDTEYTVASRVTSGGTDAEFTLFLNTATSGDYTLTFEDEETNAIAFDASAAEIQIELEALDAIGNGDVAVVADAADFDITFQNDMGSTVYTITDFTVDGAGLGGAGSETLTLTTPGVPDTATTSITLSAGLAELIAISGTVTFTGMVLEIKIGEGDLTYSETQERDYILNRGNIDTVRDGDDTPMDVAFDFVWDYLSSVSASGIPTIEDVLKNENEASGWLTTSTDSCEPYCVNVEVYYDPTCAGANNEKVELKYFRYEKLDHKLSDAQVSCTGKCNIAKAVLTRATEELP